MDAPIFSSKKESGMALIYALVAAALISMGIAASLVYFEDFVLGLQESRIGLENMRIAEKFATRIEDAYNTKLSIGAANCPVGTTAFPPDPNAIFCIPNGLQVQTMLRNNGNVILNLGTSRVITFNDGGKEFKKYVFNFDNSSIVAANPWFSLAYAQWEKTPAFSNPQPSVTLPAIVCGGANDICKSCATDICFQLRFCSAHLSSADALCATNTVIQEIVIRRNVTFF
jgi:hypothetical protein